jgi:uncharacterized protein (TIGR02145 family)
VVGLFYITVFGGIIATFLNIDETLLNMSETLLRMSENLLSMDKKLQLLVKNSSSEEERKRTETMEAQKNNARQNLLQMEKNANYFTDSRDGQKYRTVKIGEKTWMAQNLNYQPQAGNSWCYDNDNSNGNIYGRLYDWNTAMNASPTGWHLPSRQEWIDLVTFVGNDMAGVMLKSGVGWNGTDNYGFSALPGGNRNADGNFNNANNNGCWWTATEKGHDNAYYRYMNKYNEVVSEYDNGKNFGFSIRCVQD